MTNFKSVIFIREQVATCTSNTQHPTENIYCPVYAMQPHWAMDRDESMVQNVKTIDSWQERQLLQIIIWDALRDLVLFVQF